MLFRSQEFWPQLGAITYSEGDTLGDAPFFSPKLANSRVDPRDDSHPFKVTIAQMHEFNFRVRQVRIFEGEFNNTRGTYERHFFIGQAVRFPEIGEENLLAGFVGCSVFDEVLGQGFIGLNIGYIRNFIVPDWQTNPNAIIYPSGKFPVLCDYELISTIYPLPGWDTPQIPLACAFYRAAC